MILKKSKKAKKQKNKKNKKKNNIENIHGSFRVRGKGVQPGDPGVGKILYLKYELSGVLLSSTRGSQWMEPLGATPVADPATMCVTTLKSMSSMGNPSM